MAQEPTRTNWTDVAMACNPTGEMGARWRAPSDTHAPYPANLPKSEQATWDLKSEAEVDLARKLEIINNQCFLTEESDPIWDNWWHHHNQVQDRDRLWDCQLDGTINESSRRKRQEIVDLRLGEVRQMEHEWQVWKSLNPTRQAQM